MVASTVSPCVPAQLVDQLQHLLLVADVQRAGRLVEQQQRRALGQRPGQEDPLPLAAGEGGQRPAGETRSGPAGPAPRPPRPGRRPTPGPAAGCTGCAPAARSRTTDMPGGTTGDWATVATTRARSRRRRAADRRTEQGDRAGRGQQAADGAQQGRLAGAVRPDHGDPLARRRPSGRPREDLRTVQPDPQLGDHDGGARKLTPRAHSASPPFATAGLASALLALISTPGGRSAGPARRTARRGTR